MADFDWSELDKYHAYHHQSPANNPSGLVAPEASMTAPDAPMMPAAESYPDPSHVGQNRMMDIGYYQHGDNGYHGQNAGTMETHGGIEDFIADMYPDQAIPLEDMDFEQFMNHDEPQESDAIVVAGAAAGSAGNDGPLEMRGDGAAGYQGAGATTAGPSRKRKASTAMSGAAKAGKKKEKKSALAVTESELAAIRRGYTMGTLAIFNNPQTEGDRKRNARKDRRIIGVTLSEKERLQALRKRVEQEDNEEDDEE